MKQNLPQFEISLKYKGKKSELKNITCPQDAADVCRECFDSNKIDWVEEFIVIALNQANKVLGFYKISSGGISGTVADTRVIFQFALLSSATGLILCHNHPSGNLNPSEADKRLTEKIVNASKFFDIKIFDHIIITDESYYSFLENNNL
jgi:DNA repair protein RadC